MNAVMAVLNAIHKLVNQIYAYTTSFAQHNTLGDIGFGVGRGVKGCTFIGERDGKLIGAGNDFNPYTPAFIKLIGVFDNVGIGFVDSQFYVMHIFLTETVIAGMAAYEITHIGNLRRRSPYDEGMW